jgi:hypothetical protein
MSRGRRLAWGLPALALVLVFAGVRRWVELRPAPALPAATRATVVGAFRAVLDGGDWVAPTGEGLARASRGPVWVSLYRAGAPALRQVGRGPTVAAALDECGRGLAALRPPGGWSAADRGGRLKVDVTVAEGPLPEWPEAALAMGVVPGVDGLGVRLGSMEARLLPDDLIQGDLFNGYRPLESVTSLRVGLNVRRAVNVLARRLEADAAAWRRAPRRYFRFRTDSFIEPAGPRRGPPLETIRGRTVLVPTVDGPTARAAALAGVRYLLRHQRPDGTFTYEYETLHDAALTAEYSLPRHFGTAAFLVEALGATGDPAIREAARRALANAPRWVHPGCSDRTQACLAPAATGTADLGSTALALVALSEYRRRTGDGAYDDLARRLAAFVLAMQRPGGDFWHLYRLDGRGPDPTAKLLYYDGEAALALVRAHGALGDPRYLEGARRALDWLTRDQYRHFAGQFYYGEDHWVCLAAEAAWPRLRDPGYERFCRDYASFLRRQQFQPDERPTDLRGAYGFTPFLVPHNTPTGSRTEAMVSAYLLTRHHGHADERIRRQVGEALRYLLQQQLRPDTCYLCADPARADGGLLESPISRQVRIDFVQHSGSALLRGGTIL